MAKGNKSGFGAASEELSGLSSYRPVALKSISVNIGSKDGGKDRILELVEGEEIPSEVDEKFFSSFKTEGIIK